MESSKYIHIASVEIYFYFNVLEKEGLLHKNFVYWNKISEATIINIVANTALYFCMTAEFCGCIMAHGIAVCVIENTLQLQILKKI